MPEPEIIRAARDGDQEALAELISGCLPLLYNIVGRALNGHPDVDDVVQETVLAVMRGIGSLRDPEAFRSWLVAVAVRQIRDHQRSARRLLDRHTPLEEAATAAEPDFAGLTALRLGLSGQRRETAEATRWLDEEDRELLALWWLEEGGSLRRADVVAALGLPASHVAVRVQRMKERLDTGRRVVRALAEAAGCPELTALRDGWDGAPSPLWRKRFARHLRDCPACAASGSGLISAERLLVGLALVPVPVALVALAEQTVRLPAAQLTAAAHAAPAAARLGVKGAGMLKTAVAVPLVVGAVTGMAGLVWLGQGRAAPAGHTSRVPPASVADVLSASSTPTPSPKRRVAAPARPPAAGCRKGVATWAFAAADRALAGSTACWYYDWGASPVARAKGVEFVPMVWGAKSMPDLGRIRGRELLGFNEPDMAAQSNMSVEQALALWPKLTATGLRLGSPGVAYGGATPGGWLDRFMAGAARRGYRVDFIALHWYGSDFTTANAVSQLRSYLQAVHDRYHKPIWLTEYALIRFGGGPKFPSQQAQADFVRASAAMLDGLPYVERYAWFALPATPGSGTGLFTTSGAPTRVGTAFQSVR